MPRNSHDATKLNLTKTHIDKVKQQIHDYIESQSASINLENVQKQLSLAIEKFTPRIKTRFYRHNLPKFILRLIKHKRELYRNYTFTHDDTLKRKLNNLNRNIKTLIDQFRQDKWLKACQEIEQDQSKSYWQKIKKLSRYKKTCTIENINKDGTELYTDKDKADTFAKHFQEAFKFSTNPNFDVNNQNVVNNWYFNYFNNLTDNTYSNYRD